MPSSKATRSKWNASVGQLKSLDLSSDLPTTIQNCTVEFSSGTSPDWSNNEESCYVCIPEE